MTPRETHIEIQLLLVDDGPNNLVSMEAILSNLDVRIATANSGAAALEHLMHHSVDLIVMDVMMPIMDGYATAALVRQRDRTKDLPIIFITSHFKSPERIFEGYEMGAVDVITRPVVAEILQAKVGIFVDLIRKRAQLKRQGELLRQHERDRQALEHTARLRREIASFASIITHDLSRPLRGLTSYSQRLQEKIGQDLEPESQMLLGRIIDASAIMSTMLEALKRYASIGHGAHRPTPVNLQGVALSAVASLKADLDDIDGKVDVQEMPTINGTPELWRMVFDNLLDNALKYRSQAPLRVRISAESDQARIILKVEDNGLGFEPRDSERILEMFQRGHRTSTHPGTGIGLSICKKIIELHGGTIAITPKPSMGCCVKMTLPTQQPHGTNTDVV